MMRDTLLHDDPGDSDPSDIYANYSGGPLVMQMVTR